MLDFVFLSQLRLYDNFCFSCSLINLFFAQFLIRNKFLWEKMGGVCSRGTTKQSRKVGENNLKFSGKLKSVKGSNQKQHSNAKVDDLGKNKQKMSREEPALSFSRELSSNPDKKGSTKVCFNIFLWTLDDCFDKV